MQEKSRLFDSVSDEQLVQKARQGEQEAFAALFTRYAPLVESKAADLAPGLEPDDLKQEGRMGLLSAVLTFDPARGVPFRAYASVCVSHRVSSARRTAFKHSMLHSSLSLNGEESSALEEVPDAGADPEQQVIQWEESSRIYTSLTERLSPLEKKSLLLYLSGSTYEEIAEKLGCTFKAIDNALQRVRRKLRNIHT